MVGRGHSGWFLGAESAGGMGGGAAKIVPWMPLQLHHSGRGEVDQELVAGVEVQVRRSGKSRAEEGVAGWLEECSRGNLAEAGRVRAEGEPEMFIISMLSARLDSNNFATCRNRI